MNKIKLPDCVDCPLLDKAVENGCPDALHGLAIPGKAHAIFTAGEKIFEEGKPIAGIHCMHSGKVALVKRSAAEEEWIVAVATSGDVLGMPDILSGELHQNGALAVEDTSLCFIPKEEALELIKQNPNIMLRIMRKMCERIRAMEQHIDKNLDGENHP